MKKKRNKVLLKISFLSLSLSLSFFGCFLSGTFRTRSQWKLHGEITRPDWLSDSIEKESDRIRQQRHPSDRHGCRNQFSNDILGIAVTLSRNRRKEPSRDRVQPANPSSLMMTSLSAPQPWTFAEFVFQFSQQQIIKTRLGTLISLLR